MSLDTFKVRQTLTVDGNDYDYYSLHEVAQRGIGDVQRLPIALKILLENLLRFEDGATVKANDIEVLGQ